MTLLGMVNGVDFGALRDHVLAAPVVDGKFGDHPWDRWASAAEQVGLPERLVALGRAVMREAHQHAWPDALQVEVGLFDGGVMMLTQALALPAECEARWDWLIGTDGGRNADGAAPPRVTREPTELAAALKAAGYQVAELP